SGIGLIIINSLAISIEGFIADIISEHLDNGELVKPKEIKELDKISWEKKVKMYNGLFQKKLEDYPEYKSIEVLFIFRNNISHGRTHTEITKTDRISNEKTVLESVNKNYQIVRRYLIDKGLLLETDISSNVETLWKLNVAAFLFHEAEKFLFAVVKENESNRKLGIVTELNMAFQRQGI
ncbi:MAG TPA: hypothetical protein VK809_09805, partial [Bacteroidia bacterium]|nr:hypothetical protein [Bacteroidia bacterium]